MLKFFCVNPLFPNSKSYFSLHVNKTAVLVSVLSLQLRACECGKSKRSSLMERSYLSPLAQGNYDVAAMRPNQFLTPKLPYALPMAATNKPLTMNYNLAAKVINPTTTKPF